MSPSRRSFLGKAAAAAVVTATSRSLLAQDEQAREIAKQVGGLTLATSTPQTFEQWIGATFALSQGAVSLGTVELVKVESDMYPHPKLGPQGSAVAPLPAMTSIRVGGVGGNTVPQVQTTILWFKRTKTQLKQGVYTLEHDWLGTFDLLLTPSRPRKGWTYSFAVIGHFTGRMVPES